MDRESSVFLSFGTNHPLSYTNRYKNYDNWTNDTSSASRRVASNTANCDDSEFESNIASPYISLKNYLPEQYGDINDVRWVNTGYCGKLSEDNVCDIIFGGDTKISRMSLKRKIPLFLVNAMGQANFTPFAYSLYNNIGEVKYFANFDVELSETIGSTLEQAVFPDIGSEYEFDCDTGGFYKKPPSRMYLYYYGIPQFLAESEINVNFRYARREPQEWFYPNGQASDYQWWTQEVNVPIRFDNEFNYNFTYSRKHSV